MSERQSSARKLLLVAIVLLVGVGAFVAWLNQSGTAQMALVRNHADQVFDALDPRDRLHHAEECVRICQGFVDAEDPVGATAALYVIAAAPVCGADSDGVEIPSEDRVETIGNEDLLRISRLLFHTNRFGPADQLASLMLSRPDDHRQEVLRLAITIGFEIGRDHDVLVLCDEVLETNPADIGTLTVVSLVHRNHGRWEDYINTVRKAQKAGADDDQELRINLIDALVRLGQTEEARKELNIVIEKQPTLVSQAPVMHARLLINEGKREDAQKVLASFLIQAPDDAEALAVMGKLLVADQKFAEAIEMLQRSVELYPSDEEAVYQLGQAYARNGDVELAKETLQRHKSLLDTKVRIHEMELLAAREPGNVRVRDELARTYEKIGLYQNAEFWTRAAIAAEGR